MKILLIVYMTIINGYGYSVETTVVNDLKSVE